MRLAQVLSILFIFSKNQLLVWWIVSFVFVASISFISILTFMISFLLLTLDFVCSAFSSYLKCNVRLSFLFVVLFPEVGLYGYKFPLMNRTAFAVSNRFWNMLSIFNFLKVFFYLGFPCGSDSKESACNVGDPGLIPGSGRSPGEGKSNQLQYSCLGNPMDRGAWRATVHAVTELDTTEGLTLLGSFCPQEFSQVFTHIYI